MTGLTLIALALFTGISLLLVAASPKGFRWAVLLFTSLSFYTFLLGSKVLVLLLLSVLIYGCSFLVERYPRYTWLYVALLLAPLTITKLLQTGSHLDNYIYQHVAAIEKWHWSFGLQVVGLSYFTFNGISYLIDVKRKFISRESNFFLLLLYLTFLPTALSGPLQRFKHFAEQLQRIEVSEASLSSGFRLILWGLFKNFLIAQRLYQMVYALYNSDISGYYYLLLGIIFFLYLYFIFSSFIDVVQGIAQLFGIQLRDNFANRVYLAPSRQQFWKGWHITLNEWFRDYFFFVLTRYDRKRRFTDVLLLVTFLLIALWHEVTAVMLLWGTLNGLWIVLERRVNFNGWPYPNLRKYLGPVYHLSIASILALVFISPDISFLVDKVMFSTPVLPHAVFTAQLKSALIIGLAFLIVDYCYAHAGKRSIDAYLATRPTATRWFIYFLLGFMILFLGINSNIDNYYLQF